MLLPSWLWGGACEVPAEAGLGEVVPLSLELLKLE